jgi:hypothetical protein
LFEASQGKKNYETPPILTNKKLAVVVHTCHPSFAGRINMRITLQANPDINARPYSKNNKSKMG